MTEFERYVVDEHIEDFNDGLISRRELLRRVTLITGSTTHPDAIKRIQAIAQGWKEGGGEGDVADELGAIFVDMVRQLVRWEPGM